MLALTLGGVMAGNEDGMRSLIAAVQKYPLSAGTLFAVVVGGAIMFAKVTTDAAAAATRIDALTTRIERAEATAGLMRDAIGDIRGGIREINTNIQWLVQNARPARERGPQ